MGKFSLLIDGYLLGGLSGISVFSYAEGWYELMGFAIVIFVAMIGITFNDYKKTWELP